MGDRRWKMEDGRWKQKKATDAFSPRRQGGKIEDGSKKKGGVFLWPFNSQKERWIRCD